MWDDNRRWIAGWMAGAVLVALAGLTWMLWLLAAESTSSRSYPGEGTGGGNGEVVAHCAALLDPKPTTVSYHDLPARFETDQIGIGWCDGPRTERLARAVIAAAVVAVAAMLPVIGWLSWPGRRARLERSLELSEQLALPDERQPDREAAPPGT